MGRSAFFKPPQADVEAHIGRRGTRFERAQHNGLNRADLPGASGSRVLHRDGAAKWSRKCRRRRRFFNQASARLILSMRPPTLSPDVVILDDVGFHKSERPEQLVKAKGALASPCPPDLNPCMDGLFES